MTTAKIMKISMVTLHAIFIVVSLYCFGQWDEFNLLHILIGLPFLLSLQLVRSNTDRPQFDSIMPPAGTLIGLVATLLYYFAAQSGGPLFFAVMPFYHLFALLIVTSVTWVGARVKK